MINGQYIVLSFKEWNNWIAQGLLKLYSSRIQPYLNTQQSFFNLMNTAADITHLDDNEYILAKLSKSYSSFTYQSEHTLASYISLEAVQQFYALTERGKFALKHSANNLQVSLATDLEIEKFWEAYRLDQKKILEHEKALKFTGLIFDNEISKESLLDLINNKTLNEYFNPSKYEISHLQAQDEKAKKQLFSLESFDNTKAYAGMFTRLLFNLEVNDPLLIEKYKEISGLCSSKEYYSSLKEQQTKDELTSKFLSKQILREKILTEYVLLESQIRHIPLLALSLYFHYEMLIKNNYPLNLSALKEDILSLDFFYKESECREYKFLPHLVAFSIGKLLPSEFINTLYYYKTKAYLCFKATHQTDLEQALPSIADEDFLEMTLNELNEEISKTWTEVQRSIQISQISDVRPTESIKASNIIQHTVSTNVTHTSEKHLDTNPDTMPISEATDLFTPHTSQNNQGAAPSISTMTEQLVDQQSSILVKQLEHLKPQASARAHEQCSSIVENSISKESITHNSISITPHPLVKRLIQLFNQPEIQDLKSLIEKLKKDYKFSDITTQSKLREQLVTKGILNAQEAPKNGDKLFNYIKIEIAKKI